ncbi:MAG TPA: tripartite tricarboxylate transporter substrate binding protein [Burkholderiales bacterium]|nr:tripartite tricarboxylate transporter substrate binding protein [Burkholderiales bacterium]
MHKTSLALFASLSVATSAFAQAQSYPVKPVRLIAPSSPGSGVDIVARFFAQKLGVQLKQQVVVENRAGAGANIGAEIAAKAPPDGYTLFMGTPAHTINPSLYRRLNYDIIRDFVPISQVSSGQYVVVVHPALPVKTLPQLIAMAKARPGQLNYGSAGTGNATHLAAELFRVMANVNIVHVPYKGSGPALIDLVGGQMQFMFSNLTAALPHMKSAKLRALAVTGEKRTPIVPELPTVAEAALPGYSVTSWYGLLAPAGTPQDIVTRLNTETGNAMRAPDMKERLAGEGADPMPGGAAEFAALLKVEIAKWAKVVKQAGIAPE